ncbi:FtsX-like permease family protein [Streptomyces sp. ISL-100]|uniref:FtsX-like permease family protein n=1 Tax=Streptomyces sp. ISL-100 TaxID=2819173 RepID=UPI001BE599B8|nr:ABC transporter permease [Streptomyces sp. ISL-100]MBT2397305.1 ABC transporter permease [Streptomyces sp. ISL-100]
MAGFIFLRVRAHRLLLAAALLSVLLSTAVLATLAAFSSSIGDAGLRHSLRTRNAASAALLIKGEALTDAGDSRRKAADDAALAGAREAFDGLPVGLRRLGRSGPYALPSGLRSSRATEDSPDLTHLASLDRSRVRLTAGTWPGKGAGGVYGVALPEAVAGELKVKPGGKVFSLTDRLGGPSLKIRVTGLYRPADPADPYWQLDEQGGRGVSKVAFTTYGPLLADPALMSSGRVSVGHVSWLATADFRAVTTDRIGPLREAAKSSLAHLDARQPLKGKVSVRTSLPDVLDQSERSLLVSRSTLLIVSLQLVLLAGYALLLVARLLSSERAGETALLRARGGSRQRIIVLAAVEAVLLAAPAGLCAPLLAGPLTRLIAGQGSLSRIGLRLDTAQTGQIWLVGAVVAVGCAAAVVAPALGGGGEGGGRVRALPGPLRAGADIGLLVIAGVAYWQLDRQSSGSGAISGDREGRLGIDPLLVAAPALALLAGTLLTLRLLPPIARLAERRASRGRGLPAALAGWQLSRRPMRGAGPVLLLVLAVAMGMPAIGQGATWDRSQDDQADFRSGAPVRVLGSSTPQLGQGGVYDGMPGVRSAAPAAGTNLELSDGRSATVLALDTARAGEGLRLRDDLADGEDPDRVIGTLKPAASRGGVLMPKDTARLALDVTFRSTSLKAGDDLAPAVTLTLEDRYGVPYQLSLGQLRPGGRPHTYTLDIARAAGAPEGKPAGPLALTAINIDRQLLHVEDARERLTIAAVRSVGADGASREVPLPKGLKWRAKAAIGSTDGAVIDVMPSVGRLRSSAAEPLDLTYNTGRPVDFGGEYAAPQAINIRITTSTRKPSLPAAVVTDRFLDSSGAELGSVLDVPLAGESLKVKIAAVVRELPTTGPSTRTLAQAKDPKTEGGAVLLDLRAVNRVLAARPNASLPPTEWWLFTDPGKSADVASALRERRDLDPAQIQVREEIARELHDDPLGAGPQAALLAAAVVAAALAAVGFSVSVAGSLRERSAEFAILRALGAPRRRLARLHAAEQGLLIGLAMLVGLALGTVLTRAVVPLIVLTGQATQPVPHVLVELPAGPVAALLAGVAAVPLLIVAALALRRGDPATALRTQGGN